MRRKTAIGVIAITVVAKPAVPRCASAPVTDPATPRAAPPLPSRSTTPRLAGKLHKYRLQQLTASRDKGVKIGRRSGAHCLIENVTGQVPADDWGRRHRIGSVAPMAGKISMGARREVLAAVAERYRAAGAV